MQLRVQMHQKRAGKKLMLVFLPPFLYAFNVLNGEKKTITNKNDG